MQPGTVLNKRYQVVELLAEGGMAVVYLARDQLLDRSVAVKVLREQYAADQAFLERFQREARAAAGLAHPNIVSIYDVGSEKGANYIVMELVEGANLKQLIQKEAPFEAGRATDLALQILAALGFAHERGIVHRDVKPQNILVTTQGHAKVADFGIARAATTTQMTETGLVMGSVHYCAPEQAMGKGATQAADVYSAGVVLYEMLTGKLPFDSDNALGVALKHVQEPPPPLRPLNPRVAPGLEGIVLKALAKDPAQRFANAEEMTQALQAYRRLGEQATASFAAVAPREAAIGYPPPRQSSAAHAGARRAPVVPSARARAARPARRRGVDWLVVALSLFILALVVAFIPIAGRLYDRYLRPVSPPSIAAERTPAPTARPGRTPTPGRATVPRVIGLPYSEAADALRAKGLEPSMSEDFNDDFAAGVVFSQTVPPEKSVPAGTSVGLLVSRGAIEIRVPGLVNRLLNDAKAELEKVKLPFDISEEWNDRVGEGRIISQYPLEGTPVITGTIVTLVVSRGPPPSGPTAQPTPANVGNRVRVPALVRLPEAQAREQILAAGLTNSYTNRQRLSDISDPAARDFFLTVAVGSVVSQNPQAGQLVAPGTTVYIAVRAE